MKHLIAALFVLLSSLCGAQAITPGGSNQCGNIDSSTNSTITLMPMIQLCNFTTGSTGLVVATWSSQTSCTGTMSLQLFVGTGSQPAITGQNFNGSTAGGTATATAFFQAPLGNLQLSGDYDPGSGLVILAQSGSRGFASGGAANIGGLSGTDEVLNGTQTATAGTGFPVTFFTVATGQTISIGTGGTVTDAGSHTASILSGIYNPTTGLVSLTSNGAGGYAPTSGTTVTVAGLTGSGAVLNGAQTAGTNTGKAAFAFTTTPGLSITVGSGGNIVSAPFIAQIGQTVTGADLVGHDGITVTGIGVNTTGGLGTYSISYAGSASFGSGEYFLTTPPAGVTPITPVMQQNGCTGKFVITELTGVFAGAPNTQYWLGMSFVIDVNTHVIQWTNGRATVLLY